MKKISNAMMDQVEIVLQDRWSHGPLELVHVRVDGAGHLARAPDVGAKKSAWLAVVDWNRRHQSGWVREADTCEVVEYLAPGALNLDTPNVILVPERDGATELHRMLASLLPDSALQRLDLDRESAQMWLYEPHLAPYSADTATVVEHEFSRLIWGRLFRRGRMHSSAFDRTSSLHLLAGDARLWMNRVYRVAMEREEELGCVPDDDPDREWEPLEVLERKLYEEHPGLRGQVQLRRPGYGGTLWDPARPQEREDVLDEAICGIGEMDSIEPVLDALLAHPVHDDFSDRVSWIKEDFERAFYSKRSRVRVDLVETVDEFPVWDGYEPVGYDDVLFRDMLAFFDERERRLLIAIRNGQTVTSIAHANGYASHSHVSRRLAQIRARLAGLLGIKWKENRGA